MYQTGRIKVPGISEEEIHSQIQERLTARGLTPAEVQRIRDLDFSPGSGGTSGTFNPAETIDLFESPVASPKFKSSRYWFFRGPARRIAMRVYEIAALVFSKLSENKNKAFHNLVGALIAQERRIRDLELFIENNLPGRKDPVQETEKKSSISAAVNVPEWKLYYQKITALTGSYATGKKPVIVVIDDRSGSVTSSIQDTYQVLLPQQLDEETEIDGVVVPDWNSQEEDPEFNLSRFIRNLKPGGFYIAAARRSSLRMYSSDAVRFEAMHRAVDDAMKIRGMILDWWETSGTEYFSVWMKK